jgi:hypothetical protein
VGKKIQDELSFLQTHFEIPSNIFGTSQAGTIQIHAITKNLKKNVLMMTLVLKIIHAV